MKLWETYFKMWGKFSGFLTKDQKKQVLGRVNIRTRRVRL
jgi:hypothetical protein